MVVRAHYREGERRREGHLGTKNSPDTCTTLGPAKPWVHGIRFWKELGTNIDQPYRDRDLGDKRRKAKREIRNM